MFVKHREFGDLGKTLSTGEHSIVERLKEVIKRINALSTTPRDTAEARAIEKELIEIAEETPSKIGFPGYVTVGNAIRDAAAKVGEYRTDITFKNLKNRVPGRIGEIIATITGVPRKATTTTSAPAATSVAPAPASTIFAPAPATMTPAPYRRFPIGTALLIGIPAIMAISVAFYLYKKR